MNGKLNVNGNITGNTINLNTLNFGTDNTLSSSNKTLKIKYNNSVTLFDISKSSTDLGNFSIIYPNLPIYPTIGLSDIPIGALFVDANANYVVKLRHDPQS